MAGASMNDIKGRIKSVSGTMQITKAMELVATSKLRRAREKIESSRPFHTIIKEAIDGIEASEDIKNSVWSEKTEGKKPLYIVIAGDRGLAGGYNANIFRLVSYLSEGKDAKILPIGKKSLDYYTHREANIFSRSFGQVADLHVGDALGLAEEICRGYLAGEYDKVIMVYTKFVSMISQSPVYEEILPLDGETGGKSQMGVEPIYGGDPEEILNNIIPQYVGGVIYSAVCEALASESAARRTAMNAANKNASEIIDSLVLKYNRARQAVITQEITEIVSGSEAL
ncbi:MAG: ATP synthase F1 subunit gamma [Clostridia bacterium]|nr:ATP synthase F1 subunit gamma [Clostridia bacterium]